jgi:hypothetical protein
MSWPIAMALDRAYPLLRKSRTGVSRSPGGRRARP